MTNAYTTRVAALAAVAALALGLAGCATAPEPAVPEASQAEAVAQKAAPVETPASVPSGASVADSAAKDRPGPPVGGEIEVASLDREAASGFDDTEEFWNTGTVQELDEDGRLVYRVSTPVVRQNHPDINVINSGNPATDPYLLHGGGIYGGTIYSDPRRLRTIRRGRVVTPSGTSPIEPVSAPSGPRGPSPGYSAPRRGPSPRNAGRGGQERSER